MMFPHHAMSGEILETYVESFPERRQAVAIDRPRTDRCKDPSRLSLTVSYQISLLGPGRWKLGSKVRSGTGLQFPRY